MSTAFRSGDWGERKKKVEYIYVSLERRRAPGIAHSVHVARKQTLPSCFPRRHTRPSPLLAVKDLSIRSTMYPCSISIVTDGCRDASNAPLRCTTLYCCLSNPPNSNSTRVRFPPHKRIQSPTATDNPPTPVVSPLKARTCTERQVEAIPVHTIRELPRRLVQESGPAFTSLGRIFSS